MIMKCSEKNCWLFISFPPVCISLFFDQSRESSSIFERRLLYSFTDNVSSMICFFNVEYFQVILPDLVCLLPAQVFKLPAVGNSFRKNSQRIFLLRPFPPVGTISPVSSSILPISFLLERGCFFFFVPVRLRFINISNARLLIESFNNRSHFHPSC